MEGKGLPKFWYNDGGIIYRVGDQLYKIHQYLIEGTALDALDAKLPRPEGKEDEGLTEENPIVLNGVQTEEFEALLTVLYHRPVASTDGLSLRTPMIALKQAVKWDFDDVATNIALILQKRRSVRLDLTIAIMKCCIEYENLFTKQCFLDLFSDVCFHSERLKPEVFAQLDHVLLSVIVEGRELIRERISNRGYATQKPWIIPRDTTFNDWTTFRSQVISRLPYGGSWS